MLDKLESGYRMPRPEGCPAETYGLMRECWNYNADKRKLLPLLRVEAYDGVCCQEASPAHTPHAPSARLTPGRAFVCGD